MFIQFNNQRNGYDKNQVNQFVKDAEAKLQEKAAALANMQQQVIELEARLSKLTEGDVAVEEKVELYDKLMKKMDGDYENLLKPAIAKAKAIEEKAQREYEIRMDQARATADGIYAETADKIAAVVDSNMDRMYGLLEQYMYSKTLPGRIDTFMSDCKVISEKIALSLAGMAKASGKAYGQVKRNYGAMKSKMKDKVKAKVEGYRAMVAAAKASR